MKLNKKKFKPLRSLTQKMEHQHKLSELFLQEEFEKNPELLKYINNPDFFS